MNKSIAVDLNYESFGRLFVISESKYYKGSLCDCWCECGNFLKVDKQKLIEGIVKNCGKCGKKHKSVKKSRKKDESHYVNNKIKSRYKNLLRTSKTSKHKVELTLEEFSEFFKIKKCHYCDAKIDWMGKSNAYYLDRKDNRLPYTVSNCAVCCTRCNMAKGSRFTYQEWKILGEIIKSWK
jgi:hypothetical protein